MNGWPVVALGVLLGVPAQSRVPEYEPTSESLDKYECPVWFRDAKFGIYAHWGPYAVPPYPPGTDWYSHWMYQEGHPIHEFHIKTYGPVSEFGYKDLVGLFTAEKFDADAWAELFVKSGARFAGPVAEHADGFAMWNSALTEWDAKDKRPKRDVVGELEQAIRKRGLKFLTSFHHHWKWGWYPTQDPRTDCSDPTYAGLYGPPVPPSAWGRKLANGKVDFMDVEPLPTTAFCEEWLGKVNEVVDTYQPDLLWFDSRMHIIDEQYRMQMVAHYYNAAAAQARPVVLTYKNEDLAPSTAVLDLERTRMAEIHAGPWLTDTSIARNSWSYAPTLDYYSTDRLVDDLVDIVSKNGCLLLNIAPHPDGTIPPEQRERLLGMGRWLQLNGEAIYGSRPWKIFGEGPTQIPQGHLADLKLKGFCAKDVRYTQDGKHLYAIVLDWPENNEVAIQSLHMQMRIGTAGIKSITMLGSDAELTWSRTEQGLTVRVPEKKVGDFAYVLKIKPKGTLVME